MCFFHARISGKQLSLERLLAVSGDPRCFKDLSRVTDSALPSLNTHTEAMLLFHENTAGQEMELSNPILGYLARVQRSHLGPPFPSSMSIIHHFHLRPPHSWLQCVLFQCTVFGLLISARLIAQESHKSSLPASIIDPAVSILLFKGKPFNGFMNLEREVSRRSGKLTGDTDQGKKGFSGRLEVHLREWAKLIRS